MGSSATKQVNLTKSIDDKELDSLRNCFDAIVETDSGKDMKVPSIMSSKSFSHIFSDWDNFLEKLYKWMVFCKNNMITEDTAKKVISNEGR